MHTDSPARPFMHRSAWKGYSANFAQTVSVLKKSMSARSAVQERRETRQKHYENVVFGP